MSGRGLAKAMSKDAAFRAATAGGRLRGHSSHEWRCLGCPVADPYRLEYRPSTGTAAARPWCGTLEPRSPPDRVQPLARPDDAARKRGARRARNGRRLRMAIVRHDLRCQYMPVAHRLRHHRVHEYVVTLDEVLPDSARHQEAERLEVKVVADRPAPGVRDGETPHALRLPAREVEANRLEPVPTRASSAPRRSVQKRSWNWSQARASSSAAGLIRHTRSRPRASRATRPARSSTPRCFDTAASDRGNGRERWPTVASPAARRSRMARRVGSASAWKTRFRSCSTMRLNVSTSEPMFNHLAEYCRRPRIGGMTEQPWFPREICRSGSTPPSTCVRLYGPNPLSAVSSIFAQRPRGRRLARDGEPARAGIASDHALRHVFAWIQ